MEHNYDAVIIGHGPAGCSAALYLCRAGLKVAVVGRDIGSLERAERIENYYGLHKPINGRELVAAGRRQCKALGAALHKDEALALDWQEDGHFHVLMASGEALISKAALLATGKAKRAPRIDGLSDFEGRGVSYCAVCDAFLYRNREVAVLGHGAYARHEMEALLPLARHVTLITHGRELEFDPPGEVDVRREILLRVEGEKKLARAELDSGRSMMLDGLFVAIGHASAGDLAKKLGLKLKDGAIPVGAEQETEMPGLYAAGDCTGTFPQVAFAVAEGARAALGMIEYLRKNEK